MTDFQALEDHKGVPAVVTREELLAAGFNVICAVLTERNITDYAFLNFWAIAMRGWPLIRRTYSRTDIHRNEFARALLKSDYTHVFMMDADHIHPPDIVERHARWLFHELDPQIVAGLHYRRGEPFEPCVYRFDEQGRPWAPVNWPQGLIEAGIIGHGTLLVSRKVFETVDPPWWTYNYDNVGGDNEEWVYTSEDIYFSNKVREAGFRLYVDTTATSPHLITQFVDETAFRAYLAAHRDEVPIARGPGGIPSKANGDLAEKRERRRKRKQEQRA